MSGPLILGIESSCDETGVGIVRGHELLANEVASSVALHARFGGVVPGGGQPGPPGGDGADPAAGLCDGRRGPERARRHRRHRRTRADGCPGRRSGRGQGAGVRAGHAALRRQPPGRARRRRPARARSAARAVRRAPGLRRAHLAAAGRRHHRRDHRAGLDHRRRGRRGVRQGGPAARAALSRAARRSTARPTGDPRHVELPARPDRTQGPRAAPVRLLLLRAEDGRRPARRDRAAPRSPGAGARRGRQLPGGRLRRAERQGAGCVRGDRGQLVC